MEFPHGQEVSVSRKEGASFSLPRALPGLATVPTVTTLLRVMRDGNPQRRYSHVSPFIGKLAPLNIAALDRIAAIAAASLPPLNGPTLIFGLAESSLILAWWLASRLPFQVDLCFTTRNARTPFHIRRFEEPHSHGPCHFFALPPGARYEHIIIIEDELTTGITTRNLIFTIRDIAHQFSLITLSDLRDLDCRIRWGADFAAWDLDVTMIDLSSSGGMAVVQGQSTKKQRCSRDFNPYQRCRVAQSMALDTLGRLWYDYRPGAFYVIGECVDIPLAFLDVLPAEEQPVFQQVTRSPWLVDGRAIHTRLDLGGEACGVPYYLYNWVRPFPPCAVIIGESNALQIAENLGKFLCTRKIEAIIVEVPTE